MESLEKVWNLSFQFPDLEKVWKFVKSFGNFKKGLELFAFYLRKKFEDRKCASRSSPLKLLRRVWPKAVRVLLRLFAFVPIHRTNCVGQAQAACPPLQKKLKKRRAQDSSFVEKKSFASQAVDPDFSLTVFANKESSPEPVICSLRLTLPASPSHFCENLIAFCTLKFFVVSLRLPQRHDKLSFPLLCFLFFFLLKKASARLSKCASRYRYAVRTDPPRRRLHACLRSMRVGSRAKHFRSTFDLAATTCIRVAQASRHRARVKTAAWGLLIFRS